MTARRVDPDKRKTSINYSVSRWVIDAITEKAQELSMTDSSLVDLVLKNWIRRNR